MQDEKPDKQTMEQPSKVERRSTKESSLRKYPTISADFDEEYFEILSGISRGVAAATRKLALIARKAAVAKAPAAKQAVKAVGDNRPLAFASEGAVAGESMIPRVVYYGAWALSGTAIAADIYTKQDHANAGLAVPTAVYWTAFHIPASLVVPAAIIHRIVHTVEHAMENPKLYFVKNWSPVWRRRAPVAAALFSIIPVVPAVDTAAELILEPTLGKYLGLEFDHHHHHSGHGDGES